MLKAFFQANAFEDVVHKILAILGLNVLRTGQPTEPKSYGQWFAT